MKINSRGESSKDMKNSNRLLVLKSLCAEGTIKRSEIMKLTGLSKMTATNIAEDLMNVGLIAEESVDESQLGAGRRPAILRLNGNSPCVGGIYIGRKSCCVLISDLSANVLLERREEYGENFDGDYLVDFIAVMFEEIRKKVRRDILCVGISAPGPLDRNRGVILSPANFFGIRDLHVKELIEKRLNIPCVLAKDTACAAQGELLYGAGKRIENFLLVHLHNGIGGGIIVQGKLFDGTMGLGGEIGHISIDHKGEKCSCGRRGCLEKYANERKLTADYNCVSDIKLQSVSLKEIIRKALKDDKAARFAAESFCEYLSSALVSALNFIDTHHIILSYYGEKGYLEELLEEKINRSLLAHEYRYIKVISSAFSGDAPIIGAVAAAAEEVFGGNIPISDAW